MSEPMTRAEAGHPGRAAGDGIVISRAAADPLDELERCQMEIDELRQERPRLIEACVLAGCGSAEIAAVLNCAPSNVRHMRPWQQARARRHQAAAHGRA